MEERKEILLQAPLHGDDVLPLWAGDRVLLSGDMYVARDATHRRMMDDLESGKDLPFEISNAVLYYAGPSPTLPGKVVGSIGPTTSSRMDHYLEFFLKRGLRVTIGKGERS
ncbi:MAG: fumarate hydratase C-terminal domain-containing protein, partial [Atribacterota bacterium]